MSENKMIKAYDDLMNHLYAAMDDTLHNVADAMEAAKEKVAALGGHSQEEINHAADYLLRDLHHAANRGDAGKPGSIGEWLKFDIALLENFALDAFMSVADKTQVKLAELAMDAKLHRPYQTGEIASPGTFSCDNCSQELSFKATSVVPECPACHSRTFHRC